MADKARFYPRPDAPGQYAPSVTTILRVLAKPGLLRWQQEQAIRAMLVETGSAELDYRYGLDPAEYDAWIDGRMGEWLEKADNASAEAKEIGTATHGLIEELHRTGSFRDSGNSLVNALATAYDIWHDQSVDQVLMAEQPVHGSVAPGLEYAGTLDLRAHFGPLAIYYQTEKRQKLTGMTGSMLVDIKTSGDYYPEMGMQLAAYAGCIPGGENDLLLTVRLDKKTRRFYVKSWDFIPNWDMFAAATKLWYGLNPTGCANYSKRMAENGN